MSELIHAFPGSRVAAGKPMKPHNMDRVRMPTELTDAASKIALDIFVDMANAGQPFEACLRAIYLSGLENGKAAYCAELTERANSGAAEVACEARG